VNVIFTLPGTLIEIRENTGKQVLSSLFTTGGLVLSQICTMTGLEPYTIQNWGKRGFVSSPVDKKYDINQFCRIITINMLKDVLPLNFIARSLHYINGVFNDKSDDLIDDSQLYLYFVDVIFAMNGKSYESCEDTVKDILSEHNGESNDIRVRLEKVLTIFVLAYYSSQFRERAMIKIAQLDTIERSK